MGDKPAEGPQPTIQESDQNQVPNPGRRRLIGNIVKGAAALGIVRAGLGNGKAEAGGGPIESVPKFLILPEALQREYPDIINPSVSEIVVDGEPKELSLERPVFFWSRMGAGENIVFTTKEGVDISNLELRIFDSEGNPVGRSVRSFADIDVPHSGNYFFLARRIDPKNGEGLSPTVELRNIFNGGIQERFVINNSTDQPFEVIPPVDQINVLANIDVAVIEDFNEIDPDKALISVYALRDGLRRFAEQGEGRDLPESDEANNISSEFNFDRIGNKVKITYTDKKLPGGSEFAIVIKTDQIMPPERVTRFFTIPPSLQETPPPYQPPLPPGDRV